MKLMCYLAALTLGVYLLAGCSSSGTRPTAQEPAPRGGLLKSELPAGPLSIVALNSSVKPGGEIALTVQAAPRTEISIETDGVAPGAPGTTLGQRTDDNGVASWKWHLSEDYKADKVPVVVTADYEKQDKKLVRDLMVEGAAPATIAGRMSSLKQTIKAGEEVTVSITTDPKASVDVQAQGVSVSNPNQTADNKGIANWTFKVDSNYEADKVPIIVTIKKDGQERKLIGEIGVSSIASGEQEKPM